MCVAPSGAEHWLETHHILDELAQTIPLQSNLPGLFITSMAATQETSEPFLRSRWSVGASARIIGSFLKNSVWACFLTSTIGITASVLLVELTVGAGRIDRGRKPHLGRLLG